MKYTTIALFGKQKSKGTFDDFYSTEKYESLEKAYEANDYVKGDFVLDEENTKYIEFCNVSNPDKKEYHRLNYQNCPFGLDGLDDNLACELAQKLL